MTPQQIKNAAPLVEKHEQLKKLIASDYAFDLDGDDPFVRWLNWDNRRELEGKIYEALLENLKTQLSATEAELSKLGVKL